MIKLWPGSLFSRNLLLLIALVFVVQLSTLTVYAILERPRAIELADVIATQINTLDGVLSQVPEAARDNVIAQMNRNGLRVEKNIVIPKEKPRSHGVLVDLFLRDVRTHIAPGIKTVWSNGKNAELWVNTGIGANRYWICFPIRMPLHYRRQMSTTLLVLSVTLMACLAALLIQRRINRPLKDIAAAARKLKQSGKPGRLPIYSTSELTAVSYQFNAMVDGLEEMETSRALMLAGISHDIRTPLTKLRLALALQQPTPDRSVELYIGQIDSIVGQFLDYARTGTNEATVDLDLNTLIMQVAGEFEERGHRFELVLQKLPTLRFQPIAMLRVLQNLMDNAVKYGGVGLEVHSSCLANEIRITVLDQGPGIPEQDIERLLRPFVRADVGRSQVSGTGLGLAIVDRLVKLHGGKLVLMQRTRGGLAASIVLPSTPPVIAPSDGTPVA